ASVTPAHALVVAPAQVLQVASSVTPIHAPVAVAQASQVAASMTPIHAPGVVRTQAMRVDPLRRVGDWYRGPRDARDIPALEWDRKSPKAMTFEEAKAYAASRSSEGWRLPTIWELEALYQQRGAVEKQDGDVYWSGTPVEGNAPLAWIVDFYGGYVYGIVMGNSGYVRCAR
ncbi:MAG: DUF1566 domain-containing protein, partial [Myxococcaceae bacterium]|nr:DUF1566 domain-containing protein [Myxococcaceae bacterium]MBH2006112.1 DUF1566 domain-containing protein [Myxococcaceae bacterium]